MYTYIVPTFCTPGFGIFPDLLNGKHIAYQILVNPYVYPKEVDRRTAQNYGFVSELSTVDMFSEFSD